MSITVEDSLMESIDIILVSYNSEKWIEQCLMSIERVDYPLDKITINFVDNNSSDKTKDLINDYSNKSLFKDYQHIFLDYNSGFGKANNIGVQHTSSPYIYFLNIDTELHADSLKELMNAVKWGADEVALWESRQFPYEHPKYYNPVTLETSWSSGACCMVRRDRFIEVGMFDEKIFMYGEDVDLSWRFRAHGYLLNYVPKSVVHHYTYLSAGEVKPNQYYNSTYMNLMLRYKFGTLKDIVKGNLMYGGLLMVNGPAENHKRRIWKNIMKSPVEGMKFRSWKRKKSNTNFKPEFKLWDYEIIREGAFYVNEKPSDFPLVSVLIRTCNRPNVLRESLISIRNQTYPNIEVVIVEDGNDVSRNMIEDEFKDLNIVYKATVEKVGRCIAGNLAMEIANGDYLNFLDDDDLFFSDHIEVLINQILKNPGYKAAYSIGFEVPTEILSRDPYRYVEKFHNIQHRQPFNRLVLLHHNYFPIQTVMFHREMFETLGGMDPELEVLEDWDMWIRYALRYDFLYVEKLTSLYRIPANVVHNTERQELFDKYLFIVREKHFKNKFEIDMASIYRDTEFIINKPPMIIYQIKNMGMKTFLFKVKNKLFFYAKKILR